MAVAVHYADGRDRNSTPIGSPAAASPTATKSCLGPGPPLYFLNGEIRNRYVQQAADRLGISVESSMFSQYVWRGMLPTNGPVLQNSVTALWRGAHLNMWTNLDLDAANGRRGKFNEVDFEAGYERSLAKAGISAGVIRYRFPNTPAAPITEVYADATRSLSNHTILPQPECARRPSPAGRDVLWDVAAKGRKVSPIWSTYSSTSNRYA